MHERRLTRNLGVLHVINVAVALAWGRVAPDQEFDTRAVLLTIAFAAAWSLAAAVRRHVLTPLTATGVIAVGTLLPWVWIIGIWTGLVALVFALTTGVLGFFFIALWPLLAWISFVAVHLGSRWVLERLAGA